MCRRSEPWEFSQKYDYIHTRVTSGCWASFEEQIAKQAFENLQPGGWFESQEYDSIISCDDGTLPADSALVRWFHEMAVAGDICNRPTVMAHRLREVYERVGFVDVQEQIFKMPTNGWPKDERLKDIGRMWERNFMSGLAGFSLSMFNRAYNRSPEEIEVSCHPRCRVSDRALCNLCDVGIPGRRQTGVLRPPHPCVSAYLGCLGTEAVSERITTLERTTRILGSLGTTALLHYRGIGHGL